MTLKAVFFDLDGTLLDTSQDLAAALNKLCVKHDRDQLSYDLIRPQVSNGARALVELAFGAQLSELDMAQHRRDLLDFYQDDIAQYTVPFPGVTELIQQLGSANLAWGVVTNKPSRYTNALMQKMRFTRPPSAIVSPEDVGIGKPDPRPLLHACNLSFCNPQEAIYIGDHLRDIECGHNAGMDTIAVGYGFTQAAEEHLSWRATHTADLAQHIWPIIEKYYL